MSDYIDAWINNLNYNQLRDALWMDEVSERLGIESDASWFNFELLAGSVNGDYASNDYFTLTLDQIVDPDVLATLTAEQQNAIAANASSILLGHVLPPAEFMDATRFTDPRTALGNDYWVNDVQDARRNPEDIVPTEGNDYIYGVAGQADVSYGLGGDDAMSGRDGADTLYGGEGNDSLLGGDGGDLLQGGVGDDMLDGQTGNDFLVAEEGDDWVEAGSGQDECYGGDGNDTMAGNAGDDYLSGGNGDDVLSGTTGNDRVLGGNGADTIMGHLDDDILYGEYWIAGQGWDYDYGSDTFIYARGWGNDIIMDFGYGNDVIDLRSFNFQTIDEFIALCVQDGDNVVATFEDGGTLTFENLLISDFNTDNVWIQDERPVIEVVDPVTVLGTLDADDLTGDDGENIFYLDLGDDQAYGLGAVDYIWGEEGNDYFEGGEGDDWLFGGTGVDTILGGRGRDRLYGQEADDQLFGGEDGDYLLGGAGADTLNGGFGHDIAAYWTMEQGVVLDLSDRTNDTGDAVGDVFISIEEFNLTIFDDQFVGDAGSNRAAGLEGNDLLTGNAGEDYLFGNEGNDTLIGGADDDRLYALGGSDTIIFNDNDGNDIVHQFEIGADTLVIEAVGIDSFDDLVLSYDGIHTTVDYGTGTIVLREIDIDDVTADSFLFDLV